MAKLEARIALAKETAKEVATELEEKKKDKSDLEQALCTEQASFALDKASLSQN